MFPAASRNAPLPVASLTIVACTTDAVTTRASAVAILTLLNFFMNFSLCLMLTAFPFRSKEQNTHLSQRFSYRRRTFFSFQIIAGEQSGLLTHMAATESVS